MAKLFIIVALVITFQLAENQYEVVALSQPINVQTRSSSPVAPIGGVSIEHPLQATVYAYRKGKMKLLVPFEITVVPMGSGGLEPEYSSNPISGQVRPQQQDPNRSVYNRNAYRQYPAAQFGPSYYPPSAYQQPYYYAPYNGYNANNAFYGYNQQSPYRNPYYSPAYRRVDTKPWPQYHHSSSQQANTKPVNAANATSDQQNATQNWSGNNTAINISSLVNNEMHPQNALAPTTNKTVPPETTLAPPATTISLPTTNAAPEQKSEATENESKQTNAKVEQIPAQDMNREESRYVQPYFVAPPPNFIPDGSFLPNGMHFNGEYNDQINGN
ncbi:uncharacterized protein LOC116349129 [Contarinia nasturtii]|uniref:uncharacterized protein LOC116349129 n=1 Tax=Contarinia nasturtii TaxID=265458 RepID=UPI0012D37A85|nr:uncharacterized protein LOC116349129 [Contarinia nasturtii]